MARSEPYIRTGSSNRQRASNTFHLVSRRRRWMSEVASIKPFTFNHKPADIFGTQAISCTSNLLHSIFRLHCADRSLANWLNFARRVPSHPLTKIEIVARLPIQRYVITFPNIWNNRHKSVGCKLIGKSVVRVSATVVWRVVIELQFRIYELVAHEIRK